MKITKNFKMLIAMGLIAFFTYNFIFFVLCGFEDHTATFWVSWIFMMVAFAPLAVTWGTLKRQGMVIRDWLFGYPIFNHSVIYIIAAFVLSTVFVIFEEDVEWIWAFSAQIVLTAVYSILAISCFLSKAIVEDIGNKVVVNASAMKMLRVKADMLVQKCEDPELKELCKKFAEEVKYSDPMSNEVLYEIEQELKVVVSECDNMISCQNYEAASALCKRAHNLLLERNKICKTTKKH